MRILRYFKPLFISVDPIIMAYIGMNQADQDSKTPELPAGVEADIILEHLSWYANEDTLRTIKNRFDSCTDKAKRYLVVNTQEEDRLREKIGVRGFQGNVEVYQPDFHYADDLFSRQNSQKISNNAIYNARVDKCKRHYLCSEVDKLRLLTGGKGALLDQYINPKNSSICDEMLSAKEVAAELRQSYCGLALSTEEGTMRSSTEYLLSGCPVVSTRSLGGRDIYYTSENCRIVDDTPEAVRAGVTYWVGNPPDRDQIRQKVLAQINSYRYEYSIKLSQLQADAGGKSERPERMFYDLFINQDVFSRRVHDAERMIGKDTLRKLLRYPDTEIIFQKNSVYRRQVVNEKLVLTCQGHQLQLDELSSWIFTQIDGKKTVASIINNLFSVYGLEQRIADEVRETLIRFLRLGLTLIANQVR